MSTPLLVQTLVIALLVAWSALFAFRRLLPVTFRRIAARLLAVFERDGMPGWLRGFAGRLQPKASTGASCADGCSNCGGCGTPAPRAAAEAIPLAFRPRPKVQ